MRDEARIELIDGRELELSPQSSQHAACRRRLSSIFIQSLHGRAIVGIQSPVHLDDLSEPLPDVSLSEFRDDFYSYAHPTPGDIFLLLEVADASLDYDRSVKIPLYARSGIREVWLFDVTQSVVDVYRQPGAGVYAQVERLGSGDRVAPEAFPDLMLDVDSLLG